MRTEAGNLTQGLVAVTGATGFIGAHLVKRLLAEGRRVRVLVRPREHRISNIEYRTSNETVWGDLRDPTAVTRLLEGADLVFHLAAHARAWAPNPADFESINVQGTRNVVAAARAGGVHRVVHVSTELVDGAETEYQRSKRAAEQIVRDYVAAGGDAVIVRPTRVYGPGPLNPANSVTRIIALYRRGWFRVRIADGGARANYVYVEDVVDGLLKAAERGGRGAVYVLGGENLTLEQFTGLVGDATGKRRALVALPRPVVSLIGAACELGGRLGVEPLITRAWAGVLAADRPMTSDAAVRELAYRPRSAREGIAATLAWLEAA